MTTDVTTATVRNLVVQLMATSTHTGPLAVAGGTVPWLISGRDAGRLHSDLDLVAPVAAMPMVRSWLRASGNYAPHLDSLVDACARIDYGLYAVVAGVLINVAPFAVHDTAIEQCNCSFAVLGDTDAGVRVTLPALTQAEYVEHRPWHAGTQLAHFPLALVKATKQITHRSKDITDIAEIDRLGVDAERVAVYDKCFRAMELQVDARTAHA